MKKLLLVTTALLGTIAASQAGIDFHIGIGLPLPPRVIISHPAPVIVAQAPPVVYAPAPVCETPVYAPPCVEVAPRPVVYVAPRPVYYPYGHRYYGRGDWDRGHNNGPRGGWDNHGGPYRH